MSDYQNFLETGHFKFPQKAIFIFCFAMDIERFREEIGIKNSVCWYTTFPLGLGKILTL